LNDLIHAAWPVFAALGGAFLIWAFWRVMLTRSCWRCRTPLLPNRQRTRKFGLVPITRCDRCGAWRGNLLK